ncbi:hypothetical protein PINS_up000760 [Pythium insidiosum]|nr:hypothetical protein PINS_up000760 [Pythium insidiosum]
MNQHLQQTVQQHVEEDKSLSSQGAHVADGIGELNPELSQKLARLEFENETLKSQIDGTTAERIDSLLDEIDDISRLKASFETKYFSTVDELQATQDRLRESQKHGEDVTADLKVLRAAHGELQAAFASLEKKFGDAETQIDSLRIELQASQDELSTLKLHEYRLLEQLDQKETEIQQLVAKVEDVETMLAVSREQSGCLTEDILAHEMERSALQREKKSLLAIVHDFEMKSENDRVRISELEERCEVLELQLSATKCMVVELTEELASQAMGCEDLLTKLGAEESRSCQLTHELKNVNGKCLGLKHELDIATVEIEQLSDEVTRMTTRLEMAEEEISIRQYDQCCLRDSLASADQNVVTLRAQLAEAINSLAMLQEDMSHQCTRLQEKHLQELDRVQDDFTTRMSGIETQHNLERKAQIEEMDSLRQNHSDSIARMTDVINSKSMAIEKIKVETEALRVRLEGELAMVHEDFSRKLDDERARFADYARLHSVSDEETNSRHRDYEKSISALETKLQEERTSSVSQCKALTDQLTKLQHTTSDMKQKFESQESKLREAIQAQLEANRKLFENSHAIKAQLAKKEARVLQLEGIVTRLESQMFILEKERAFYTKEGGGHRSLEGHQSETTDSNTYVAQILSELEELRKEHKTLVEQHARCSHPDPDAERTGSSFYMDRIRQLEAAKALEVDKKRELLLANAKLIQDQKRLQVKNALTHQEIQQLKEKLHSFMLREERRKKEHQKLQLQVAAAAETRNENPAEAPLNNIEPKVQSSVDRDLPPPVPKHQHQPIELESVASSNDNDSPADPVVGQENVPPPAHLDVVKKRKASESEEIEKVSSDPAHDAGVQVEDKAADTPSLKAVVSVPRPAKRRLSHFISNRHTAAPEAEQPSECQQQ